MASFLAGRLLRGQRNMEQALPDDGAVGTGGEGDRRVLSRPSQGALLGAARHAGCTQAPDMDAALLMLLYGTVGSPDGWTTFIDGLAASYGGGMATLFMHDYSHHGSSVVAGTSGRTDCLEAYARYYSRINPWIVGVETRAVGLVTATETVVPYQRLLATEFYNDWCRPHGIGAGIGVTVQRDGRRMMALSVLFPRIVLERDAEAIARLQRLVPHLLAAARLERQFAGLKTRVLATEGVLDAVVTAMMVVDAAGRIGYLNAAAEQLVADNDGLIVVREEIRLAAPAQEKRLRGLIAIALQASKVVAARPGGMMRVSRPSGRMDYEVLVAPIRGTVLILGFTEAAAVVFVRDPDRRVPIRVEQLRCLYDLTEAEARLMQALLAGDTLNAVAAERGLSKETLRSQLKAVFLKTGTSSQLELIRLGLKGIVALQR